MSRPRRLALALVAVCLLGTLGVPAAAHDPDERLSQIAHAIQHKQALIEKAEEEERTLLGKISASDARRDVVEDKLAAVTADLAAARQALAPVQAALEQAEAKHTKLVRQVAATKKRLANQVQTLGQRAATTYAFGPGSYIDVYLGASSFGDMIARSQLAEHVLLFDSDLVDEIESTKARLLGQREAAAEARDEIRAKRDELAAEVARVERLAAEQAAAKAAIDQEIAVREDALDDIEAAKAEYEEAVAQLQAESDRIRAQIQATGSTGGGNAGGTLYWPTSGGIGSGYGWRTHPIFGTPRFHAGVDIGGACGQPIWAADSGTVLSVGWSGGYGLFTVVDHGDGLSTAYAHQSSTSVSAGQSVGRGQVIGAVGTTGWSTGCHLHFEVRVNGNPVDPVPYIT